VPWCGELIWRAGFLLDDDLWNWGSGSARAEKSAFVFAMVSAMRAERTILFPMDGRGKGITYRLPEFGDRFPSPDDVLRI
jgi:hypothetical protein